MTVVTSRADFERLADLRLAAAKLLLAAGDWDGAYYIGGYAVEFALKVRIIAVLMQSNSFPDKRLAADFYKHDLAVLRRAAGLEAAMDADPAVEPLWDVVSEWTEQSRYQIGKDEPTVRNFVDAIENGVLPWIKARW